MKCPNCNGSGTAANADSAHAGECPKCGGWGDIEVCGECADWLNISQTCMRFASPILSRAAGIRADSPACPFFSLAEVLP